MTQKSNQPTLNFMQGHAPKQLREAAIPLGDLPINRMAHLGPGALSTPEILALIIGGHNALDTAYRLLENIHSLDLPRVSHHRLMQVHGIGKATATRIQAALHLGLRISQSSREETPRVTSPADAAHLMMDEMKHLAQEHIRVILLNTRNFVIATPTIYIGSLNTSIVRPAELFKPAIEANAAALIVVHNHPTGDPSPSPEDISFTRSIVAVGKQLSIDVLDHLIIGHNRFTSLKERQLGFD